MAKIWLELLDVCWIWKMAGFWPEPDPVSALLMIKKAIVIRRSAPLNQGWVVTCMWYAGDRSGRCDNGSAGRTRSARQSMSAGRGSRYKSRNKQTTHFAAEQDWSEWPCVSLTCFALCMYKFAEKGFVEKAVLWGESCLSGCLATVIVFLIINWLNLVQFIQRRRCNYL